MSRGQRALLPQQSNNYLGAEFEVFGKVQGVYFRNHTKEVADRLGVVGWVANSQDGTVVGEIQGERDAIIEMMTWLQAEGSPASVIKKTVFQENWYLPALRYSCFEILQQALPRIVKGEKGGALKEVPQRELVDTITFLNPRPATSSKKMSKAVSKGREAEGDTSGPAAEEGGAVREVEAPRSRPAYVGRVPTTFLKPKLIASAVDERGGN